MIKLLILDSITTAGSAFNYAFGLTTLALGAAYFLLEYKSTDKRLGLILKPIIIPFVIILVIMIAWPFFRPPSI